MVVVAGLCRQGRSCQFVPKDKGNTCCEDVLGSREHFQKINPARRYRMDRPSEAGQNETKYKHNEVKDVIKGSGQ